jgi:hypothetical protein
LKLRSQSRRAIKRGGFERFRMIPCPAAPSGESPTYAAFASEVEASMCFQASSSLFSSTKSNSRAQNGSPSGACSYQ